jgi:hypothetical protein
MVSLGLYYHTAGKVVVVVAVVEAIDLNIYLGIED